MLTNKDSSPFVRATSFIRNLLLYPFKVLALSLGIPNFKIVYKSGHVEYFFFANLNITESDKITKMEWLKTDNLGNPFFIGINDIESIVQLY